MNMFVSLLTFAFFIYLLIYPLIISKDFLIKKRFVYNNKFILLITSILFNISILVGIKSASDEPFFAIHIYDLLFFVGFASILIFINFIYFIFISYFLLIKKIRPIYFLLLIIILCSLFILSYDIHAYLNDINNYCLNQKYTFHI